MDKREVRVDEENRVSEEFVFDGDNRVSYVAAIRELIVYRECVWSFAARSLRVRYKQAALGIAWAVLQPLAFLAVFIIFFGHIAGVSGGGTSYAAFALAALVPWQFVANGVSFGGDSLIQDGSLIRKVYFPREAPVLGSVGSFLPDFGIGLLILLISAPFTGAELGWNLLWVPMLIVLMILPTIAIALPLAALAVYYRDFKYALPFGIQLWLFASPVAYPVTEVSPQWRWLYALINPVVGMLEGFRRVIALGAAPEWGLLALSTFSSTVILVGGFHLFKRLEREFADVI